MTLAAIVRALGGDLYDGGRRANVPAPGHSAADRSVSLLLSGDRVVAHGFGEADWREILDHLRSRGLIDRDGRLAGGGPCLASTPNRLVRARGEAARALWAAARPIAGTLAERHVRLRAVQRPLSPELRHHPAVPAAVYEATGPCRPALLAAIRDASGALCAVEITYLAADGSRARMARPRKTVGVLPPGAAVRLDAAGPRLLVAEGIFTALSASERFAAPAWALLSTSNLRAWTPPPEARQLIVAGDRGQDGERSARRLAARARALGLAVALRWAPAPHGDWNEAAAASAAAAREAGGRAERGEPDGRMVRTDGSELQ